MKTILHPDYWVEVPAGEFLIGLSDAQRDFIRARACSLDPAIYEYIERHLGYVGDQKPFWVDRFYIARFSITRRQYGLFREGTPASNLPGALEEPAISVIVSIRPGRGEIKSYGREVAPIPEGGLEEELCQGLRGRLPDGYEWEKAARGTDGRLYPWGNEWDPEAGDFYYGQPTLETRRVDAYPRGVSPYGVWAIVGGLPELASMGGGGRMGFHARESSAETAWFDHIVGMRHWGLWVSLRSVLDKWPRRQWPGFQAGLAEPNAEALQKMGPLADLLLTQFDWSALETKVLDILEPAIVALREGRKAESQALLTEILHNDPDNEAAWLLQAAALEDVSKQRECVQRALALNPESEVGQKMGVLLKPPVRTRW